MSKQMLKAAGTVCLFLALLLGSTPAFAQNVTVKGNVKDAAGVPVIGASVIQQGTMNGVITDIDGNYQITVPASSSLQFTSVGYVEQVIAVEGKSVINVVLAEDTELLEEVVVVGYGTIKKSDITGSVASVDREAMLKRTPTNIGQALQGAAAGVIVTQQDGAPEGLSTVRVRGVATINGSADPLYVVDGVQVGTSATFVNPSDIESIEILKDASATAIYGSAGANGVIMITTKHGEKGRTNVTFTADYGVQTLASHLNTLDIDTYAASIREAKANDGLDLQNKIWDKQYDGKRNAIDWQRQMTRPALRQQYGVSINGGNDKTTYNASVGYLDNNGLIVNTNYKRLTARANVTSKITNFLEVGFDLNYTHNENHGSNRGLGNNGNLSSLRDLAAMAPTIDYVDGNILGNQIVHVNLVNPDGTYGTTYPDAGEGWEGNTAIFGNVYANQMEASDRARQGNDRFMGTANVALTFLNTKHHKLDLRSVGNWTYWGSNSGDMSGGRHRYNYINGSLQEVRINGDQSYGLSINNSSGKSWSVQTYLTYAINNLAKNNFSLMLGNEVSASEGQWVGASARNFLSVDNRSIGLTTDNASKQGNGAYNADVAGISYFARLMYSFKDRYVLTGTIRRDGSSKFGANNKYGIFPSFSLGWNFANEEFLNLPEWISMGKLRFSWGQNGSEPYGNFLYTTLTAMGNNVLLGSQAIKHNGSKADKTANPDLKWEASEQTDLGIDLGFLQNTLTLTVDYFDKRTNGMIIEMPIPSYVGETKPVGNVGDMSNKGVEIELGYKGHIGDFSYNVKGNVAYIKNTVENLGNSEGFMQIGGSSVQSISGFYARAENGMPYGYFYGYKTDGIFQNMDEVRDYTNADGSMIMPNAVPGDVRFVDVNGDGTITDEDRTNIGNGHPDWTFGLNVNLDWKGFDLGVFMQGVAGADIFDGTYRNDVFSGNYPSWMLGRWTGEGTSNKYPRLSLGDTENWKGSDLYVCDGSYFRIKNLSLGYTIPTRLTKKAFISRLRVYGMVDNLFTWTKYWGFDPEISSGSGNAQGIDRGVYPQPRTLKVGVNVTF